LKLIKKLKNIKLINYNFLTVPKVDLDLEDGFASGLQQVGDLLGVLHSQVG
jgi:hypothetical protein